MPRKVNAHEDVLAEWESTLNAMTENSAEFPFLQGGIDRLQACLLEAREEALLYEQAEAQRRAASRKLTALLREGKKVATYLRVGLKYVFGNKSPRLLDFGIKPLHRQAPAHPSEIAGAEPEPTSPSSPVPPAEAVE